MEPVDVVSDVEIMIGARNNRVIRIRKRILEATRHPYMVLAFACRPIFVQEGQSRGTCKKASESSKDLRSYM